MKPPLLPILGAVVVSALAPAVLQACSSSGPAPASTANDAGVEAGQDATAAGDAADAEPSDSRAPFDATGSCFTGVSPTSPDAAAALIYGSCVPHLGDAAGPVCYESGHIGDIPDSGGVPGSLQMTCMSAPENGTWSTKACDRTSAAFGCQTVSLVGDVCATVTTTWYYPPATGSDEVADCPPPFVVVAP
jgi:hypothetical protein